MSEDIVERLRNVGRNYDFHENALIYEAADEIECLRAEIERLREHIAEQQLDIVTLGQEVGRLREALVRWQCYGCPDCGDDCRSSDNAIFANCIMRQTRAALREEQKG